MQGPWYTFEEVQELLSFNRSELLYQVDTGAVRPVVTTKQRPFLVFRRDKNQRWIGLGTCSYRGCLTLHSDSITSLIENGEIRLGKGSARLLEPQKVKNWSGRYPFKQLAPFDVLAEWSGSEWEVIELSKLAVTPLPLEGQSSTAFIGGLAKSAMQFMTKNDQALPDSKEMAKINEAMELYPYTWNFDANSKFSSEDLRIAASEIERFKTARTPELEEELQPVKQVLSRIEGKRTSQLHQLILRVLVDNPDTKSKDFWRLIQNDWESDEPLYDLEGIIVNMDAVSIEWRSLGYTDQSLKRASFGATVSKLKKKL
ncbi:hypothetical protein [Neptunomonas sp.]|uniref:hypothetical protein n=1 Tax=Neptunomonas sp. TaxID=1971898 RepID=UPI002600D8CD|nr:hypothetical protein [Neptunomonas sp.]